MNNKQVAHLWANRSRPAATGSHFYFTGDVIYSYGPHFPIARLIRNPNTGLNCVLFTTRAYSNTTARHKSITRAACSHLQVFYVSDVMAPVVGRRGFAKLEKDEAARVEAIAKKQAESEARSAKRNAKLLAEFPGMTAWEARRAKREASQRAAFEPELAEWRNGGPLPRYSYSAPVALRLRGEVVETTKGAQVPVESARVTFKFISSRRESGWHRNGDSHAIGPFSLEAVNAVGIVAGCHRIGWQEIDAFAQSQGWTA